MTDNTLPAVIEPPQAPAIAPDITQDFDEARTNLKELSETAMEAVKNAAIFASQAQNDKMYAALASLVRAANETQRDAMDLHKRKKDLIGQEQPKHLTQQLIMTSKDVLKLIRGEN